MHRDTISSIWNTLRKATENNVNNDVGIVNSIHSQKVDRQNTILLRSQEHLQNNRLNLDQHFVQLQHCFFSTTTLAKAIESGEVKMKDLSNSSNCYAINHSTLWRECVLYSAFWEGTIRKIRSSTTKHSSWRSFVRN